MRFSAHDQLYGRLNVAQEDLPFRSETDFFCTANKQRLIQFLFQCLDGLTADWEIKSLPAASEKLKVVAT